MERKENHLYYKERPKTGGHLFMSSIAIDSQDEKEVKEEEKVDVWSTSHRTYNIEHRASESKSEERKSALWKARKKIVNCPKGRLRPCVLYYWSTMKRFSGIESEMGGERFFLFFSLFLFGQTTYSYPLCLCPSLFLFSFR